MKKTPHVITLFLILISVLSLQAAPASLNSDSVNFEQQRSRVNGLLEQRSQRFGEFDLSLQKKTGIFGMFKTKSDMQKSIDILRQIVITDNNIFIETKRLLDIKDFESERNATLAKEYDKQVGAYMKTITTLQDENEKLRTELVTLDHNDEQSYFFVYLLLAVIAILIFALYRQYKAQTRKI